MAYAQISAENIGAKISGLRILSGETMEALARSINVTQSAITMYESGRRIPRDEIKIRIADHFGVPVESIFFPQEQHDL